MSVFWLCVVLFALMFVFQVIELTFGKRPRKLILKDQVNSNLNFFGFIAIIILLMFIRVGLGTLSQVVQYKYYQGWEWLSIAFIMMAAKILPVVVTLSIFIFFLWSIRNSKNFPYNWNIWKYTPEEIEYTKNRKALLKERNRKRLNPKVFKFLYPEKKSKKAPKYPRLYKFIFGEEKKDS